jgi:hypothetical protein
MGKFLSQEAIRRFEDEGYVAPIPVVSPEEMRGLRRRLEAFERDHPQALGKLEQNPHLLFRWLDGLIRSPTLLDALEDLLGPDLFCLVTAFRRKEPGAGTYAGWHQDAYYLKYDPFFVTCLVAFTEQTAENGCLRVIPGSHRWELLPHEETDDDKSLLTRSQRITAEIDTAKAAPVELAAGQAMVFRDRLVHGSPPNRSRERRVAFLMDVVPARAKRIGSRDAGTLLRGRDTHGHFDVLPRPKDDFGPDALSLHRLACETRDRESYKGSRRTPPALA